MRPNPCRGTRLPGFSAARNILTGQTVALALSRSRCQVGSHVVVSLSRVDASLSQHQWRTASKRNFDEFRANDDGYNGVGLGAQIPRNRVGRARLKLHPRHMHEMLFVQLLAAQETRVISAGAASGRTKVTSHVEAVAEWAPASQRFANPRNSR